jgi:hypothetical protein
VSSDAYSVHFGLQKRVLDSSLPPDDRVNPFVEMEFEPVNAASYTPKTTVAAHSMSVAGYASRQL